MEDLSLDNITDDNIESIIFNGDFSNIGGAEVKEEKENNEEINPIEEEDENIGVNLGIQKETLEEVDRESQEEEDTGTNNPADSPDNLYSSIAKDLLEEGVLTLDDADIDAVVDGETFANALKKQVDSLLDEDQRRIREALNNQVPVDTVSQYEHTISNLKTITDEQIKDESGEGEELRKQLIYADYINKGFTEERAKKEVKKSFDGGNDIEDAKDAIDSLIGAYKKEYDGILKEAKDKEDSRIKAEKEQVEKMKKRFMETEEPVKGIKLTKSEREKMFLQATKLVGKDENNKPVTELQKYAIENPLEYQYYINLLYSQTNGFKDLSKVISKEAKSQNKTTMKNLEKVLKNQNTNIDSGFDFSKSNSTPSFSSLGLRPVFE